MKVKFYGTRGSVPVYDRDFLEFGGNTTCIRMFREDLRLTSILDAGTGIIKLGRELVAQGFQQEKLFIGFTHFHWDHIQGFPFFAPAYNPSQDIAILAMGKGRNIVSLESIFAGQMQSEYFPVPLDKMGARFNFILDEENKAIKNNATISTIRQSHPGGSYGYRLELGGTVLVVCTDVEHGESLNPEIVAFAAGADLLIHEAQYTDEELEAHRGWGHSSYTQAIAVAEQAGAKTLAMTHHDPAHDDVFLKKQEKICQERFRDAFLAREGMEFEI